MTYLKWITLRFWWGKITKAEAVHLLIVRTYLHGIVSVIKPKRARR